MFQRRCPPCRAQRFCWPPRHRRPHRQPAPYCPIPSRRGPRLHPLSAHQDSHPPPPRPLPPGAVATPLDRRLAGEAGVDLTGVVPSGPRGRIVARDVEAAVAARTGRLARGSTAPSPDRIKALYEPGSFEEIPLDNMRRTIAARLAEAKQTIPHFYLTADVAMERLNALREQANAAALRDGAGKPEWRLSINDFIIKALALALQRVPAANAVWAEDRILRFRRSDVGVAV